MPSQFESTRATTRHAVAATHALALLSLALTLLSSRPATAQWGSRCSWSGDSQHVLYLTRANYNDALALGAAVRIVAIDTGRGAVTPTEATIRDGSYPLTYSWYVVTTQDLPQRAKTLLKWLDTDEGKQATASVGRRPAR